MKHWDDGRFPPRSWYALTCLLRGHVRHESPPFYWHSHERCARCNQLAPFDSVARNGWRL